METVNQENTGNQETNDNAADRTFTQAEVDAIVGERLARDRAKYADYDDIKAKADKFDQMEEKNKSELQKAIERGDKLQTELDAIKNANAIRDIRSKVAEETGVPASLITAETEEDCKNQARAILDFSKPGSYPNVRDGGEVQNKGKPSTKQQFEEWLNQT